MSGKSSWTLKFLWTFLSVCFFLMHKELALRGVICIRGCACYHFISCKQVTQQAVISPSFFPLRVCRVRREGTSQHSWGGSSRKVPSVVMTQPQAIPESQGRCDGDFQRVTRSGPNKSNCWKCGRREGLHTPNACILSPGQLFRMGKAVYKWQGCNLLLFPCCLFR